VSQLWTTKTFHVQSTSTSLSHLVNNKLWEFPLFMIFG
jgi:hypothetical protein